MNTMSGEGISGSSLASPEVMSDLKALLSEKAADLFSLCDQEEKGFVTKRDMQRLRGELPLDPDQLEAVFDTLDGDLNGYLTLEEFTEGFSAFLGIDEIAYSAVENEDGQLSLKGGEESQTTQRDNALLEEESIDDDEEFQNMLSELGILGLIDDGDMALKEMWANLKKDKDPALMANFEEFLTKLSKDLHKKTTEHEHLENNIKTRSQIQEEHLQQLYEEMEQQIGQERERIRAEEEKKEAKLREELELTLSMKDQQLVEVMSKMKEMQDQLDDAKKAVPTIKDENVHLAKERDKLQNEVERQKTLMRDLQDQMDDLRHSTQSERRERAKAAFKVSESIAQEREGLVQQLNFMKALNTKMLDDQDQMIAEGRETVRDDIQLSKELELATNLMDIGDDQRLSSPDIRKGLDKCNNGLVAASIPNLLHNINDNEVVATEDSEYECDETYYCTEMSPGLAKSISTPPPIKRLNGYGTRFHRFHSQPPIENLSLADELAGSLPCLDKSQHLPFPDPMASTYSVDSSLDSQEEETAQRRLKQAKRRQDATLTKPFGMDSMGGSFNDPLSTADSHFDSIHSGRSSDVNTSASGYVEPLSKLERTLSVPERVFKVIFIGDSSVGKSSLITRFCTGKFRPGLKSTIGVDFHTKSISVEEQTVCLQCWDTAGQERYRSITRQYFRKADAVVIVYDITSEKSFLNAQQWMESAVDGAGEWATLMLVGNKLDLAEDDLLR